jgi:uracil phosphoribosyltransferase
VESLSAKKKDMYFNQLSSCASTHVREKSRVVIEPFLVTGNSLTFLFAHVN